MYETARPAYVVGKTVNFFSGRPGNSRTGEGSFARLKNGDIFSLYSEFYGQNIKERAETTDILRGESAISEGYLPKQKGNI